VESKINRNVEANAEQIRKIESQIDENRNSDSSDIANINSKIDDICDTIGDLIQSCDANQVDINKLDSFLKTQNRDESPISIPNQMLNNQELLSRIKYSGSASDNPIQFLNEIRDYFNMHNINSSFKLGIAVSCLQGMAKTWWRCLNTKINTYEQFEKSFKDQFWGRKEQDRILNKLVTGKFYIGGTMNRWEYALNLYELAQELKVKLTDDQIIQYLVRHYEPHVVDCFNHRNEYNWDSFILFLRDYTDLKSNHYNVERNYEKQGNKKPSWNKSRDSSDNQKAKFGKNTNSYQNYNRNYQHDNEDTARVKRCQQIVSSDQPSCSKEVETGTLLMSDSEN